MEDKQVKLLMALWVIFNFLSALAWIVNFYQLIYHEDKFTHILGVFIPWLSLVTVFMG